jgi:hypothetical protein
LCFVALVGAGSGCGDGLTDLDASWGPVLPGQGVPDAGTGGGTGAAAGLGSTAGPGTAGGTGTAGGVGTAGGTGTAGGMGSAGGTGSTSGGISGGGLDAGGTSKPDAGVAVDAGKPDTGSSVPDASATPDTGTSSPDATTGGGGGDGDCCPSGDCLCHGTVPARLSAAKGPFKTATVNLSTGTAHYPTDAKPPFAGIAICPGFLNSGPEMTDWGVFYASWGIVTVVTDTIPTDVPEIRADKLIGSIKALKAENMKSGSPLNGKMSGRYGTSGYSMGGGGTTMASVTDPTLKSSVGLAPWEPVGRNIKVPTLLMCGSIDAVAPCSYVDDSYAGIPNTTPKMKIVISGAEHLASWFGPDQGGNGTSGGYALAFNKVFLEGDERWKTLLLTKPSGHEMTTNITK